MNQKLQKIIEIIQHSEKLDAEQKENLLKAVKDADKELEITAFKLERTEKVKKTTAILLEETIEELEQKRKAVEEQNHELEIEASLERVRSLALGMRKSEEVGNVTDKLFKELNALTLKVIGCTIVVLDEKKDTWETWRARTKAVVKPFEVASFKRSMQSLKKHLPKWSQEFNAAIVRRENFLIEEMSKRKRTQLLNSIAEQYNYTEKEKSKLLNITPEKITAHFLFFKLGYLALITEKKLPDENLAVARRFVEVFSFAYTRFIDIKKAEEQAREAQIEASLERVRAVAMGMNKSEDLLSICKVAFKEFQKLGFDNIRNALIHIQYDEKKYFMDYDFSDLTGGAITKIEYGSHPVVEDYLKQINSAKDAFYEGVIKEDQLKEWKDFRKNSGQKDDPRLENATALYYYFFSIGIGDIGISTLQPIDESQVKILKRFRNVFDLAYRRYTDIAQAEAQAREAQIEASLERVRARSMAMHESRELREIISCVFEELQKLDFVAPACSLIFYQEDKSAEHWFAGFTEGAYPQSYTIPYIDIPYYTDLMKAWKDGSEYEEFIMEGQAKVDYAKWLLLETDFKNLPKEFVEGSGMQTPAPLFFSDAYNKYGMLEIIGNESLPEDKVKIVKRMSKVFEQTYTRFLDLQKAEAQAREAQIEAALERVRSRSLGMHHTSELQDVINTVYQQFKSLDIAITGGAFIAINEENKNEVNCWGAGGTADYVERVQIPFFDRPIYTSLLNCIKNGKGFYTEEFSYEEKIEFFNHLFKHPPYSKATPERKKEIMSRQGGYTRSCAVSKFTCVFIINHHGKKFSEEENNILKRFGIVFEQSYTRFLDLQKAEAQAKEAQIEASLERVRSRSIGMQKSEELHEVIKLVYEQFIHLKINVDHAGFVVGYTPKGDWHFWIADKQEIPSKITHPYFDSVWANQFDEAKEKGIDFFTTDLNLEEKNKFYQDMFKYIPGLPDASKEFYFNCPGLAVSTVLLDNVSLYIENFSGTPYSDEDNKILMRFGKVFQQIYTRFLDLQKAEAQAREAKIEASLEKVRTVALTMKKSDEMLDIAQALYEQLLELGFSNIRNTIIDLHNEKDETFVDYDYSHDMGRSITLMSYHDHPIIEEQVRQIQSSSDAFFELILEGQDLQDLIDIRLKNGEEEDPRLRKIKQLTYNLYSFGEGAIGISNFGLLSEEQKLILKRFRNVFAFAYKRYSDMVLAETQARESQIQLALERVRARTMAMHKSEELSETSFVLFEQLKELGEVAEQISILIYNEKEKIIELYATIYGNQWEETGRLPFEESSVHKKIYSAWKKKKKSLVVDLTGEELKEFNNFKMKYSKQYNSEDELPKNRWVVHNAFFSKGVLTFSTYKSRPAETLQLLERFAGVFDLTYTRFLDLQKAEAQVREAEIEAALERVRSRTMAMQKSDELAETASHFFQQLNSLGIKPYRFNIAIVNQELEECQLWSTSNEGKVIPLGPMIPLKEHKVFNQMYDGWKAQQKVTVISIQGDERIKWTKYIMRYVSFNEYKPENIDLEKLRQEPAIFSNFFFKQGFVVVHTIKKINETDLKIIQRFVNVFEQTYTRFLDLQKAEAQAKEAVKQASLDRIRGEIASMRTSEDLNRITPIIWRELKTLEVPFIRCGVFIVEETKEKVQVYLTTPDGKSLGVLNLSFDANQLTTNTVDYWRKKQVYREHWDKKEFIDWTKSMIELGQIQSAETYQGSSTPPESLHLHFVPFAQGMLYVGDISPLTDEKLELVKTLSEAFSIAYARYEDFKNLEDAKNKIELTLHELKAAQAQLVHSEKMASLGELTAGIAHEIKNPLNFVNNFSEVSRELLDEMKTELQNKNEVEVAELIEDLKQNLEKITQHGKRADSIVKGMLLHSRGTAGEKTLTDINDLLDQYVNLAYHGMRATNKEFNIIIEKDYDETLEKINVVPQDISRVFLNIINNACYAAYDRKKKSGNDFSPTLKVSTKNLKDKVEIKIGDNGNGIPKEIIDKIFQPFFTTKPTGEGTGLGLSLSYDIVTKVHGGELRVETKEDVGTEFIIILNN